MTKPVYAVILALVLLSGCSKDSNRSEDGSTRSDAGPRSSSDAGTPPEPNRVEDAAIGDSASAAPSDAGSEATGGGGTGGDQPSAAGSGGRPASPGADAGAGASPSEPDTDSGPGELEPLCSSCGGCEQVIEVVSTMHTNNPVNYPDPPPTSGPHNPCWGRWGVHDEPLAAERWVHNLEHGGVVFLYNCPDGCDQEVAAIKQLNQHRHRTIITTYAVLPTRFAVVSWGHRLLSDCFDLATFDAFYERNFDRGPESNANPPNPTCPP
jgi:hypothetical protein